MKQIINQLINSLRLCAFVGAVALLTLLPTGCSDANDEALPTDGTPIELIVSAPTNGAVTRAKTSFAEGDVIWVDATFPGATPSSQQYKLTLKGGKWLTEKYGEFLWPEGATGGTFKAYFIGNKAVAGASSDIPFQELKDEEGQDDPLFAETGEVAVGGAVHLLFAHTLTKLYISGLPATTTQLTWKGLSTTAMTFTKGLGYTFPQTVEDATFTAKDGKAVCFLHVIGDGTPEMVLTPASADKLTLPATIQTRLKGMKPGRAYALSFGAGGMSANLEELDKWWINPQGCIPAPELTTEQINAFFTALKAGNAYQIGTTEILEQGTRRLLICLDFKNQPFTPIDLGVAFNGDYHTIYNVSLTNSGLFSSITTNGSISHLALENVTVVPTKAIAPIGAFTGSNKGTLTDIHLKGVSTFTMKGFAATIGGMIGKNEGALDGLSVSGKLTITHTLVDGSDNFVGGMIGENIAALNRCVVSGAVKITTTGSSSKEAHIGGLAGTLAGATGLLKNSVSNAQVDASGATASNLYVGGMAGSIWCQAQECSASGYIIGGTATGTAATGGWAGYVNHADITKYPNACSATGDVRATATSGNSYTGGLIGQTVVSLKNCSSVGSVYQAVNTNGYTGGLVGMIAADKLIYNSFSMSKIYGSDNKEITIVATANYDATNDARLSGLRPDTKIRNCHYQGYNLDTRGGNTATMATALYLNNSVNESNQYLRWSSNSNVYTGAPYLMYKQRPNN